MAQKEFKLQQVLNVREEEEKRCTRAFAAARGAYESACTCLEEAIASINQLDRDVQRQQREGISAVELRMYADFFQRKSVDIRLQRLETETLQRTMDEKRELLVEAAKDKKALEILKEKKALEHKRELAEKERLFLEEIAIRNKLHGR
jgi:flagellar protein FliJ